MKKEEKRGNKHLKCLPCYLLPFTSFQSHPLSDHHFHGLSIQPQVKLQLEVEVQHHHYHHSEDPDTSSHHSIQAMIKTVMGHYHHHHRRPMTIWA